MKFSPWLKLSFEDIVIARLNCEKNKTLIKNITNFFILILKIIS